MDAWGGHLLFHRASATQAANLHGFVRKLLNDFELLLTIFAEVLVKGHAKKLYTAFGVPLSTSRAFFKMRSTSAFFG